MNLTVLVLEGGPLRLRGCFNFLFHFFILVILYALPLLSNRAMVSFMCADIKYNEKQGVKFCEVQNGSDSVFWSDELYEREAYVATKFADFFSTYNDSSWFTFFLADRHFKNHLVERGWNTKSTLEKIVKDPLFLNKAKKIVVDPTNLFHYHGVLFAKAKEFSSIELFRQNFPGILIIDESTFP